MVTLSKGQKAGFGAYLSVILVSVVMTIVVMSGVEGQAAIPAEPSLYTLWTVAAGAIGGGIAFFLARGWLGQRGAMGFARAVVGAVALSLIAAVITGALIFHVYGAFYGPVLFTTTLITHPVAAFVWIATLSGAHYMMTQRVAEEEEREHETAARYISAELSSLTQAQLYGRH